MLTFPDTECLSRMAGSGLSAKGKRSDSFLLPDRFCMQWKGNISLYLMLNEQTALFSFYQSLQTMSIFIPFSFCTIYYTLPPLSSVSQSLAGTKCKTDNNFSALDSRNRQSRNLGYSCLYYFASGRSIVSLNTSLPVKSYNISRCRLKLP